MRTANEAGGDVPLGDGVTASTIVDPDDSTFLFDHQVRGSVVLPTAVQLGLVMGAIRTRVSSGVALELTCIAVEDPVLLAPGFPCTVRVEGSTPAPGRPRRFAIRSSAGLRHLVLHAATLVEHDHRSTGLGPCASGPELPGDATAIYPPMFHGPAFQVVERFGRIGDRVVTRCGSDLPAWDTVVSGVGGAAQLTELLLQSCGVWELTETGRMMRPSYIERLLVAPRALEPVQGPAWAEVWPSVTTPAAFDGVVVDAARRVLLRMSGYLPLELGPASPTVVRRLRSSRLECSSGPDRSTESLAEGPSPRHKEHT